MTAVNTNTITYDDLARVTEGWGPCSRGWTLYFTWLYHSGLGQSMLQSTLHITLQSTLQITLQSTLQSTLKCTLQSKLKSTLLSSVQSTLYHPNTNEDISQCSMPQKLFSFKLSSRIPNSNSILQMLIRIQILIKMCTCSE